MVLHSELEDAWAVGVADGLQCAEIMVRHEVAELLEGHAIATGSADGIVLDGVNSSTVLHIKISSIQEIEGLRLEGECVPFAQADGARHAEIQFDNPRTIERVKAHSWAWPISGDSSGSVASGLQRSRIVQDNTQTVAIVERKRRARAGRVENSGIWSPRIELRNRAYCPVR